VNLGTEQQVEQKIAVGRYRRFTAEDEDASQAAERGRSSGLTAMVRLCRPGGDQRGRPLAFRIREKELELPRLVSTEGESRLIIPLNEDARAAEGTGKSGEFIERRWKVGEPVARQRMGGER
jgi:hypothetical protein